MEQIHVTLPDGQHMDAARREEGDDRRGQRDAEHRDRPAERRERPVNELRQGGLSRAKRRC